MCQIWAKEAANGCCNRLVGDMFWRVFHFRRSLDMSARVRRVFLVFTILLAPGTHRSEFGHLQSRAWRKEATHTVSWSKRPSTIQRNRHKLIQSNTFTKNHKTQKTGNEINSKNPPELLLEQKKRCPVTDVWFRRTCWARPVPVPPVPPGTAPPGPLPGLDSAGECVCVCVVCCLDAKNGQNSEL